MTSGITRQATRERGPFEIRRRKKKRRLPEWSSTILFMAALFGAVGVWNLLVAWAFPADQVNEVAVVHHSEGEWVLFVSEYVERFGVNGAIYAGASSSRLSVYDPATGKKRSRRLIELAGWRGVTVLGPGPGGVWAYEYGTGVVLLDPRDGRVRKGPDELLSASQRDRVLVSTELRGNVGYLAAEQSVVITLEDGSRLMLNGTEARPYSGELPAVASRTHPTPPDWGRVDDGETLRLQAAQGEDRRVLRLRPSGTSLFRGGFLVEATRPEYALIVGTPPGVLVRHRESLDENSDYLLSRVALDTGQALWSARLNSNASIAHASRTDELVVIVTSDAELIAFQIEDGQLRYRVNI